MSFLRKIRDRFSVMRIEALRRFARVQVNLSTLQSRAYLKKTGVLRILVDNSVLGHAITHETAWISTGTKKWGSHDIETGYAARIPVHSAESNLRLYNEIRYLPGIALLAKRDLIELYTSAELRAEVFRQPIGRFSGYGYYDHNLLADVRIESLDGVHLDLENPKETQIQRLRACQDEPFKSIVGRLGEKNSLDAWHIHTAERHGMFCFLCIDFPLRDAAEREKEKQPFVALKTQILTPSEFGKMIGLVPVNTNILSYEGSSFPVHAEYSWPDQRRNRPRKRTVKR